MIKKIIKMIIYKTCSFKKRVELLRKDGVKIWENCEIYRDVIFWSEPRLIEIGNNVRIVNWVTLTTHDGGVRVLTNMWKIPYDSGKFWKIKIGNNVHIWINSIIMPGVNIGNNVIIGAWSIVTKNIPSNSVAAGIPCKVIESIEEYYKKNYKDILCFGNMSTKNRIEIIKKQCIKKT